MIGFSKDSYIEFIPNCPLMHGMRWNAQTILGLDAVVQVVYGQKSGGQGSFTLLTGWDGISVSWRWPC